MDRQLNLIKTEYQQLEKRVLPRFPFSFLMFKHTESGKVFEISDISHTGMQLVLKDGTHQMEVGQAVGGTIQWRGHSLVIESTVKWASENRLGVAFEQSCIQQVEELFCVSHIVEGLRAMHQTDWEEQLPSNLHYWLRADSSLEIFIWGHSDKEFSRFQFIILDYFVEWQDGKGVKSGKVINKRDLDTPLFSEGELIFQVDEGVDFAKIGFAKDVIGHLSSAHLPRQVIDFLKLKLGG